MPKCITCGVSVIGRGIVILEDQGADHFLFSAYPQEKVYRNAGGQRYVVLHTTHFYSVFEEIMKRELEVMFWVAIGSMGGVFGEEVQDASD